jgi:hypothetical protein
MTSSKSSSYPLSSVFMRGEVEDYRASRPIRPSAKKVFLRNEPNRLLKTIGSAACRRRGTQ